MSTFIKGIVIQKLKQISYEDLLFYGNEYGIQLEENEAKAMANYIKNNRIDPFNEKDRMKTFHELAQVANEETAIKTESLFNELIKSYGLEHLFE